MIHGLSKHTTVSVAAIDYFLAGEYLDKESGEWKPRDPAPQLLEGDPIQMRALCDSLSFKNRYTSGVLSFTKDETDRINGTPGMKEALIEELRSFAYAGFKNDDSKALLVVQHSHLDRLELHYMIPRVSLESGLYFNPFPPNYDGKRGPGNNQAYIKQNDSFVDHVCEKYGLQNPRDPAIEREHRPPTFEKFSENKEIRRQVVKALNELVDCGKVKSRDDMSTFLKSHGAEITRQGSDYFSFKFPEMRQAIKLKGELYGEQSFDTIKEHFEQRRENFEASRAGVESRFAETIDQRAEEIEERHGKRTEEAERAKDIDPRSERELTETAEALKDELGGLDNTIRDLAADCVRQTPGLMKASGLASGGGGGGSAILGGGGGGGSTDAVSDTSVGKTGNAVLDELIQAFHSWKKAQAKKAAASVSRPFPEKKSSAVKSGIKNYVHAFANKLAFKVSVATGYNFVEPDRGKLQLDDMKLYRKALNEQLIEARRDLKELERLHKAERQVEETRSPLAMVEKLKAENSGLSFKSELLRNSTERWKEEQKERKPKRREDDEYGL